jgi:hypothetical protein
VSATPVFTNFPGKTGAHRLFEFFGLGRSRPGVADAAAGTSAEPGQISPTQREMVRLTLHNVLRRQGIPFSWIAGEVAPMLLPDQREALLLQLVVLKWHDGLMQYAPAIQKELLDGFRRIDPAADANRYQFSWKFAPDCGCPHTQLPGPGFCSAGAKTEAKQAAKKPTLVLHELDDDDDDAGFAPTQIHHNR